MKYVKFEQKVPGDYHNLTVAGESLFGNVQGVVTDKSTQHGLADYLVLEREDESLINLVLTSNLKNVNWEKLVGKHVQIEYLGLATSKKGREFKSYTVYVAEE